MARDHIPLRSSPSSSHDDAAGAEETKCGYDVAGASMGDADGAECRHWVQYRLGAQDEEGEEEESHLVLNKQTGDTWDALEMPRPKLIQPPPPVHAPPKPSVVDFESAATEVSRMSRETQQQRIGPCGVKEKDCMS